MRVAARATRAVVRVLAENGSGGSGFVMHPDGWVLTNDHVVAGAARGTVQFVDGDGPGRMLPFEVVVRGASRDLALLRVLSEEPLAHLELGSSAALPLGAPVLAVGAPQGMFPVVSTGVLGGRSRPGFIGDRLVPEQLIHGAPTLRGSSGCPLLDDRGRVIGIQSAKPSQELVRSAPPEDETGRRFDLDLTRWQFQTEGFGLAVPVEDALELLPAWIAPEWTTGLATGFELDPLAPGAVVRGVSPDSAAQRAGLRAGDRVVALGGQAVNSAIDAALSLREPVELALVAERDGTRRELTLRREPWRRPAWDDLAEGLRWREARGRCARMPDWGRVEVVAVGVTGEIEIPAEHRGREEFVLELTGWLDVPSAGRWELELESDDGALLFVRDRLVVDGDGLHAARAARGAIELEAGPQPVRVLYFEAGGDERLRARWGIAGEELVEIPPARLGHVPVAHD